MSSAPKQDHRQQRILAMDLESAAHPPQLLDSRSRDNSFHGDDDDRMPLLDPTAADDANSTGLIAKRPKNQGQIIPQKKRNVVVILLIAVLLVLISIAVIAGMMVLLDSKDQGPNRKVLIHAKNGAVATELDTCSIIGVKILREGGNAVDAAIASGICIGSINMFSAGIGGGGFMVVRLPNSTAKVFNFRETAPAAASKGMYNKHPLASLYGGLSVGVPGEIAGYFEASRMYGKLPWKRLFKESIEMTRDGFPVPPELANRIKRYGDFILKDPDWGFLYPQGKLLVQNDLLFRTNFSHTLSVIANEGPRAFYNGSVARGIVEYVRKRGGIMTMEDMANYPVRVEEPVYGWYHGRQVITCGAPCSGPALIQALNILEGFSLGSKKGRMTPQEVHLVVESMKCRAALPHKRSADLRDAAAARTELGDPFDPVADRPVRISELTSKDFAALLRSNISLTKTYPWTHYNPKYDFPRNHGTTHISVIDKDGMTTSLTSTINLIWGSQLHDPVTGIILNDEMDDFSQVNNSNAFRLEPSPYNYIKPFKRPMSSSAPTIILNPVSGAVELVLGASGGTRILTSVLDAIVKYLDWRMDLLNVVENPRLHHQLLPERISMEKGYDRDVPRYLRNAGHVCEEYDKSNARAEIQVVRRIEDEDGTIRLEAVSDSRKNGIAAGISRSPLSSHD